MAKWSIIQKNKSSDEPLRPQDDAELVGKMARCIADSLGTFRVLPRHRIAAVTVLSLINGDFDI